MQRIFHYLKVFLTLYILTLMSCKNGDSIDTKNVFERASKNDSLSYYFPSILNDTVESRNAQYRDYEQKWYSSPLYSFKEPILYTKTDSETIYRLLWLRSFHQPVCFTMKDFNTNFFLSAKTLDRQPSFYLNLSYDGKDSIGKEIIDTLGKGDRLALVDFNTIRVLTIGQWKEIENYMSKLDFWNSPVTDPHDVGAQDGSNWILEGRKNGKYHFNVRHNANGELMALGKYLIKVSGLKIKEDEIY